MNLDLNHPKHVAIILDGNRRFAKRLMLEPWKGHEYGKDKVEELLDYAKELGVNELTLYCLSCENIKNRPKDELEFLYKIFKEIFKDLDIKLKDRNMKIRFVGNLNLIPLDLKKQCEELEKKTENNKDYILNLALAYGGRQELVSAVRKIIEKKIKAEDVDDRVIEENLLLKGEPDIIIRTGGEKRTSNFLPWQSSYSEWFFLDKMWPEFQKQDLADCIEEFKNRKRNFGK